MIRKQALGTAFPRARRHIREQKILADGYAL